MNIVAYTITVSYHFYMFEECLYFNSNALARTVSRIWIEAYKPFDLSPPHAFLLRVVLNKPGLMPRELAEALSLSRSTVTRFLDSLEKRDLLVRKATTQDGREVQVYPKKKAKLMHKKLDQTGAALSRLMNEMIGRDDVSQTVNKLRELHNILETR
ncbi:MAG: MarR family transcriptional regulator [Candidatus Thiodiazotropha sp. (ex Myrtea sp. 'scaly one' KF741663)]|nr:MarR family transcriptional regulator [Candidatus Thiodiazotropha sp. (ex Myrtea sp. 'scaly one' KF741663)]